MKNKISILAITIIVTLIVFGISTYMQKKLINYEATVACLVLVEDIYENELVHKDKFKIADVPISIIATQKIVTDFSEIDGLYSKDNIKTGQIAVKSQFDTKENLSIFEAENGKEKISIKVKTAENAMSYQIKENSFVNVYVTLRNDLATDFLLDKERMVLGSFEDGYTVIKLLENIKVLGVFNIDGIQIENSIGENIDSILIAVTTEEAKQVNLLREIATFNITGVNIQKNTENNLSEFISGDMHVDFSGEDIKGMSGE